MILQVYRMGLWGSQYGKKILLNRCGKSYSVLCKPRPKDDTLTKHLNINKSKAEYLTLKYPVIKKLTNEHIVELISTIEELGYTKDILIEEPVLFSVLPITIKFRHKVLIECAFQDITPRHIASYLPLVKQKTVETLKKTGEIQRSINIENRLASYMTQWPTSLTTLIYEDVNKHTLYTLRLKIMQRYLELVLDLSEEEFYRGVKTYPTIRHRPLAVINETLTLLQSKIMIPSQKIKSNFYLVHVDPENLKHIIYDFKAIGGIDIKEVIRLHPKIATKKYSTLVEIRKILQDFGISNGAQIRCFDIYTLAPATVQERLEKAKTIPEFSTFLNHPRFLKMIHYNNTAMKRIAKLYSNNKKCLSLNILSGSSAHYETYEKAPGDRLGKGKDLIFCLSEFLGNTYSKSDIRKKVKRHPYWINIPLVQVKYVHQKLSVEFTSEDIYENCPILFYPWSKIREMLKLFKNTKKTEDGHMFPFHYDHLDFSKLNNSQKLSLMLYLLEKNHYFTGNGVWSEEKSRSSDFNTTKDAAAASSM